MNYFELLRRLQGIVMSAENFGERLSFREMREAILASLHALIKEVEEKYE